MSEDERHEMLRTVDEAHSGLKELVLRLRRHTPKSPAHKAAVKAEQVVFRLKRELQQLDLENLELPRRRDALPEVRRGGNVIEVDRLGRRKGPNDVP